MATRYYFPFGTGAPAAPVSVTPSSSWDLTGTGYHTHMTSTVKANTALAAETYSQFYENTTTVGNLLHAQYVSDVLGGDQVISGNFTLVMRCGQASSGTSGTWPAADMTLQVIIRVIAPDGSVRGIAYAGHTAALGTTAGTVGQEMNTSTQVRLFNNIALTNSVNALNGDRVVIELGHRHHNTINDYQYGSFLHLGDSSATDHTVSTTTQSAPGWLELTSTLVHNAEGSGTATSTGTVANTGQKVAKVTGAASGTGTVSATGKARRKTSGSISETVSASSTGIKVAKTTGTITTIPSFAKNGKKVAKITGTIAETGTLTPAGIKNSKGTATLSGTSLLTYSGKKVSHDDVSISGTGTVSATGTARRGTRYYFPFSVAGATVQAPPAPVTTISPSANWNIIGDGFSRGYLVTRKRGTALTAETSTQFAELSTTVGNLLHKQYVSDPILSDQNISGTFTLVLRAGESNAAADMSLQVIVRIIKPDGTERGVLYAGYSGTLSQAAGASGQELSTSTQVRLFNAVTVTPVSAVKNDRVVVELGTRHYNTSATSYNSYLHLGDALGTDHALGTATQAAPGWFELSAQVGHSTVGETTPITGTSDVVGVGKKVAKTVGSLTTTSSLSCSGARRASTILNIPFDGADGSTPGTTGTGLSTVIVPAGSTVALQTTGAWSQQFMKVITDTTAQAPQVAGTISPGQGTLFARFYIKLYAYPDSDLQVFRMRGTSSAQRLTMRILTDGKVQLHNGTAAVDTSTNPITLNKWILVRAGYFGTSMELKTYEGSSSSTPSKSLSGAATNDTIQSVMFGFMNNIASYRADFDEAKFDYTGYPDYVNRTSGSGSLSGSSSLTGSSKKVAKGAWGIVAYVQPLTSTGDRSNLHRGSGTVTTVSSLTAIGKKVAKVTGAATLTGTLVNTGSKTAKGANVLSGPGVLTAAPGKRHSRGPGSITGPGILTPAGRKVAKGQPAQTLTAATTTLGSSGGKRSVNSAGSISATSAVSAIGRKVARGTVSITAISKLRASVVVKSVGTLTSTGKKVARVTGTVSGTGLLTNTGAKDVTGAGTVSGSVGAANAGKKVAQGQPASVLLAVTTTLGSSGRKRKVFVTGLVTGSGSVTSSGGRKSAAGANSFSGTGSLTAAGRKVAKGNGVVYNTHLLSSNGGKNLNYAQGTGLVSGTVAATSTGKKVAKVSGTISTVSTLTPVGRKVARGSVVISGITSGPTSTTGSKKVAKATGTITGIVGASGTGSKSAQAGDNIINEFITTVTSGSKKGYGTGLAARPGVLTNTGKKSAQGTGFLAGFGALASTGAGRQKSKGSGQITGLLSATAAPGKKSVVGNSAIMHTAVLATNGRKVARASVLLAATGGLSSLGGRAARGSVALGASSGASSSGRKVARGLASSYAVASLSSVPGKHTHKGSGVRTAVGTLSAVGGKRNPRTPIRVGHKRGAVLVGSSIGLAIPLGGYPDD